MPDIRSNWDATQPKSHSTISQMGRSSTAETVTLLHTAKPIQKPSRAWTTVHQVIPPQQEERLISACSAEANHTANRTLLHLCHSRQTGRRLVTLTAFTTSNATLFEQRESVLYISKDSQPIRKPATRHFISGISSTDYTERRKPSLMYGHWYRHTSRDNPEVQYAFKISMTHWILQFALRIAVRSVLHRCASLDIHCWKLLSS